MKLQFGIALLLGAITVNPSTAAIVAVDDFTDLDGVSGSSLTGGFFAISAGTTTVVASGSERSLFLEATQGPSEGSMDIESTTPGSLTSEVTFKGSATTFGNHIVSLTYNATTFDLQRTGGNFTAFELETTTNPGVSSLSVTISQGGTDVTSTSNFLAGETGTLRVNFSDAQLGLIDPSLVDNIVVTYTSDGDTLVASNLQYDNAAVPEPATLAWALLLPAGLIARRKLKK